ncbi:MAG: type III secretion protein [Alphaproteobacteria bacterium]|jgi:flagellar biosynthetic protein FliR|nr:type III secretion protein [Alphaproteobacteria bacterium]
MISVPAELLEIGQESLFAAIAVFLRVGAMMALLPAFGERSVPVRVKLGLALAFTLIILPAAPALPALSPGLLLSETVTGLFFGLLLRLFVFALQIAGTIAAQSTSLSQIFGGSAGADPQPAMAHILVVAGLALAATMGLHVAVAEYMIHSYSLIPPGRMIPAELMTTSGVAQVARSFSLGFTLAAPFVIASLLYNVTLGVINRAMPQLMVAFVGAPAITAGGLILLFLSAPILLSVWLKALQSFLVAPFGGGP